MGSQDRMDASDKLTWTPLTLLRDGHETRVRFCFEDTQKPMVGTGRFGEIRRVRIQLQDDATKRWWPRENSADFPTAILKLYTSFDPTKAEHAVNMHQEIKDADVSTWNTYLLIKDQPMIFMTDGASGIYKNDLIVSSGNDSLDKKKLKSFPPHKIDNFEACVSQALFDVEHLSKASIVTEKGDVWFTRFSPKNSDDDVPHADVHLFPGDFDMCEKVHFFDGSSTYSNLILQNVHTLAGILTLVVLDQLPISDKDKMRYLGIIQEVRQAIQGTHLQYEKNVLTLAEKYRERARTT